MSNYPKLELTSTRVKKYKKYRKAIKSDFELTQKKNAKNDEIKEVEKHIAKIDKTLLLNKKIDDFFYVDFANSWIDSDKVMLPAKNYLENIRNCNFTELYNRASSVKRDDSFETCFDTTGNISTIWLNDDEKYSQLLELKSWIKKMVEQKQVIIDNTKEKIFSFKDAYYKATNPTTVKNILPKKSEHVSQKINIKNKHKFYFALFSFFICITTAIILLVLFFV